MITITVERSQIKRDECNMVVLKGLQERGEMLYLPNENHLDMVFNTDSGVWELPCLTVH